MGGDAGIRAAIAGATSAPVLFCHVPGPRHRISGRKSAWRQIFQI